MKKRYLYCALFGLPGLVISLMIAAAIFGVLFGVLWLFVFGDDPWPVLPGAPITGLFLGTWLAWWCGFLAAGFILGRRLESDPGTDRAHILMAAAATIIPLALIVLYQFRIGNLGARSDTERCSDACRSLGHAMSGMPPGDSGDTTCTCYDAHGNPVSGITAAGKDAIVNP